MNYIEFKNKWVGKGIDYDGSYGNQCMDVYRQYVKEVLLCPQSPPVQGAKNVWDTYLPEYFERIANSPTGVPQQGDIVIWGMNPYGHIAICDHASTSTLTCFEQNWTELNGSGVTEIRLHGNYNNVLGWLRFKKPITSSEPTMTEQERVMLQFIKDNKITEGMLRQGQGYITDNIDKKVQDLEDANFKLQQQVSDLTEKLINEKKSSSGWHSALNTANLEIKSLRNELLSATDKLTVNQLFKLIVKKLTKK